MDETYQLGTRRVRAIRLLALVFLLLGVHRTATLALPLVEPAYMGWLATYEDGTLKVAADPFVLLPAEPRAAVMADAAARERFGSRLDEPGVRAPLFLIEFVTRLPELALMFCLGIALWRSSRRGTDAALSGTIWLARAGLAAVSMALLTPLGEGVRTGLLLQGVVATSPVDLHVDFGALLRNLLFAGAAWAAAWTISAGLRARADLAEIV